MSEERDDSKAGRALTLIRRPNGGLMVELKSVGDIGDMARVMAGTGIGMRAGFRGNLGACFKVAWQAAAWAMDPFAVASKAYIVKNQRGEEEVSYEAQLIHAAVNGSGALERPLEEAVYDGEGVEMSCTVTGTLKGGAVRVYTSPKIKDIRVKNSPLWTSDPEQQLWYFSVRNWARKWCPDVILGVYAADEAVVIDGEAVDVSPTRPSTAARQAAWSGDGEEAPPPPKPEQFASPPDQEDRSHDGQEYELTDVDGEISILHNPSDAISRLCEILEEAASVSGDRLRTTWENNLVTADELCTLDESDNTRDLLATTYGTLLEKVSAPPPPPDQPPPPPIATEPPQPTPAPPRRRGRPPKQQPQQQEEGPPSWVTEDEGTSAAAPQRESFKMDPWPRDEAGKLEQPNKLYNLMRDRIQKMRDTNEPIEHLEWYIEDNRADWDQLNFEMKPWMKRIIDTIAEIRTKAKNQK